MLMRRWMLLALLLGLAGCQPGPKYNWGNYSGALYAYYEDPKAEPDYEKALQEVTSDQDQNRKVPPGLYAEYGYEELAHGNVAKAIEMFEREEKAWPESARYMEKAIALAKTGQKTATPEAPPSPPMPTPSASTPSS
jgi:hypothetical protein